ncbi:ABC transporter ATP-binding protein [Enterovibrio sp. ZSDZ35]|uniref:ABC transporter ATP-binding protein n=1 Tax=Enterovibrio qingdaonensis TaxID=2899818 RepID=A0ABT5QPS5_9GAMM|nr:ABC transporter ATP-binding protein [Enterovibrio sp. ZSDZ35]MDD1782296.1 ABC transporter ATP-binding protein [Enterovibrio sp. ZSDZ35]
MSDALTVSNLICRYNGQAVLNDLTFNVKKGEIVCLLGASGCGKTTLLKAIAGLLPLDAGKMSINGRTIVDSNMNVPPEQRKIGMIFQDYALFPHLTVAENVSFGLKGWDKATIGQRVSEMLALVKLDGLEKRYPHQLSGGQQQRVAIARALASKPDLLLLDEPFSNIDTQVRHSLIKEIRRIFKEQGVTAIFVTHSREEAFAFADKLAVMNQGVIEQYGGPTELYYTPSSRFVADFLGHGSYVPVRLNGDKKMHTPLGDWAVDKASDGSELEWLIRPQNLTILPDEMGNGTVTDVQFMGDSCRYLVTVNDQNLMVYSNQLLGMGDKVTLDIRPHEPILFKPQ